MCRVLEVSTSGFYDWLERPASLRQENNLRILGKIRYFHARSRCIYGSPKLHKDLIDDGEIFSVNRVARLMRAAGIKSKMARKFVITTNSKNTMKAASDLLKRKFIVEKMMQPGYLTRLL
jgi:putative transposase